MSLATSCPTCGTVFRVVQDQLKVSEGWVRCGHCQEVFNALEGLFDLSRRDTTTPEPSPDLAVPATSNPNDPAWMETRPAMFSDGKVLRERQEALQNRAPTAPTTPPSPTPPATRVEISTRRAATWDPSVQEPERGMAPTQPDPGAWRTTSADTSLPPPALEHHHLRGSTFEDPPLDSLLADPDFDTAHADDTAYPATTLEFRSEAFGAFAAARLRRDGRPDVDLALDLPTDPAPLTLALPEEETPQAEPLPSAEVAAAAQAPLPESAPAVEMQTETAPEAVAAQAVSTAPLAPTPPPPTPEVDLEQTLDLSAGLSAHAVDAPAAPAPLVTPLVTPLAATPAATAATTESSGDEELPEFVRRADSQARWHRPVVRAALGGLALVLGGVLLGQVAYQWHDLIAARWPATRPLLEQACVPWHCTLAAPRALDALVVDSTTLSRPPTGEGYVLGVTLHNRAGHAIAAPHIELSLTDLSGAVVVRRVLTPADFRQADTLAGQSDASWSLAFTSANPRIAGYTLAAFYP